MTHIPNTHGGGAKTNKNGLRFEQTTSLKDALQYHNFILNPISSNRKSIGYEVYNEQKLIGYSVPKHALYSCFLAPRGIDYRQYNSKQWLPDECFINEITKTAFIIEKKFQSSSGSVDEKLPSCHFKKREYEKLFFPLGYPVVFIYVFNDWFQHYMYRDTLQYIEDMSCYYFFNEIPLTVFTKL